MSKKQWLILRGYYSFLGSIFYYISLVSIGGVFTLAGYFVKKGGSCCTFDLVERIVTGHRKVVVFANSGGYSIGNICAHFGRGILLVFINEAQVPDDIIREYDVLWFHRREESSGRYFGSERVLNYPSVYRLCIKNGGDRTAPDWSSGVVSAVCGFPFSEYYPVGKEIFSLRRKGKKVESSSSGFVVLSMLNKIVANNDAVDVYAIGFGRLMVGPGLHAWGYERRQLSRMNIRFYDKNFNPDNAMFLRSLVPDFMARVSMDIVSLVSRCK